MWQVVPNYMVSVVGEPNLTNQSNKKKNNKENNNNNGNTKSKETLLNRKKNWLNLIIKLKGMEDAEGPSGWTLQFWLGWEEENINILIMIQITIILKIIIITIEKMNDDTTTING